MTDLTPHEAQHILRLQAAGASIPPELYAKALEFCAAVDDEAERIERRYLALPWWRKLLWRIGVWR